MACSPKENEIEAESLIQKGEIIIASLIKVQNSYRIKFYLTEDGKRTKQHMESYTDHFAAKQRKLLIDDLEENKDYEAINEEAEKYRQMRANSKNKQLENKNPAAVSSPSSTTDNYDKDFNHLFEKWKPIHGMINANQGSSIQNYMSNIKKHVLPYFDDGKRIVSSVSQREYDEFIVHMRKTRSDHAKYQNIPPDERPYLATSSVVKVRNALNSMLQHGFKWNYMEKMPTIKAPPVKYAKTEYWTKDQLAEAFKAIEDEFLHLVFHLCLVGSTRAGEVVGIEIDNINLEEKVIRIEHSIERIDDEALKLTNFEGIKLVFPKKRSAKSSLVKKIVKTEESDRLMPITDMLMKEIEKRLQKINQDKLNLGPLYNDYGLLICYDNGNPIEVTHMNRFFKKWIQDNNLEKEISIQGLRKSAQMLKVRINDFDYQKVAREGGHTVEVLKKHYDERILEDLQYSARKIEENFYLGLGLSDPQSSQNVSGTSESYKALLVYLEPAENDNTLNKDGVEIGFVKDLIKLVSIDPNNLNNALLMYNTMKASCINTPS